MQEYKIGKYKINFPKETKFEINNCDCYETITFFIEGHGFSDCNYEKYEIINNYHMGYRIFVSTREGWCDIPLTLETLTFLPSYIVIVEEK